MTEMVTRIQDFSAWTGTPPFFEGFPEKGRHAYVARKETTFVAYLAQDIARQVIGEVKGKLSDLDRFLAEMKREGAHVSYGAPPFDTNTGGEKPISQETKPG